MLRIDRYMMVLLGLLTMLLAGCSSGGGGDDEPQPKPTLSIYIYAPNHPIVTRTGEEMGVEATDKENEIKKLQIWIFKTGTEEKIGYLELTDDQLANLNSAVRQEVYRIEIPEDFASTPAAERSKVDVYVLANVSEANCGSPNPDGVNAHRFEPANGSVEHAKIGAGFFCPATSVPADGLPMSGVLRNIAVTGENPVLKITTATLDRAVSKIRFVFSSYALRERVKIEGVQLDGHQIPEEEYFFLRELNTEYKETVTQLLDFRGVMDGSNEIRTNDDPSYYRYDTEEGLSTFVNKIALGLRDKKLTEWPVYLRESDKQLSGKIFYKVGNDVTQRVATFQMSPNGSFMRNHAWIVYGYFASTQLHVETVDITPWEDAGMDSHTIYNW